MRIVVCAGAVPRTLDASVPWHFFQELVPLVQLGHELVVVTGSTPTYQLPGIQFRSYPSASLRRNTGEVLPLLSLGLRHLTDLPRPGSFGDARALVKTLRVNAALVGIARECGAQVIHSHWAEPRGSAGYLAARELDIPLVMTLRGHEHIKSAEMSYGSCLDPFYERTLKGALSAASAITICCSDSRDRLADLGVHDAERVHHVFHAVNPERFNGSAADALALKTSLGLEGTRVVTCVAILDHPRKGHATLLKAFREVLRQSPDLRLVLVGDGSLRPSLEAQAREMGIDRATIFTGKVHPNEIQHYMRMAEMTVLPTHCEVFGNVVFESLILGVPVISGNVGAARDVLPAGPYGLVFEPGVDVALADAIRSVLGEPSRYRTMAALGRDMVLREMGLDQRVRRFSAIYETVVSKAKR